MTGAGPLVFGNLSDRGKAREENEDYFASLDSPAGRLFVVADGMGGQAGGKVASQLAVDKFLEAVKTSPDLPPEDLLRQALEAANQAVYEMAQNNSGLQGMGSTFTALLLRPEGVFWINVGDSRIYRVFNQQISQVTKDQTLVQQMIDGGLITPAQAAEHPERHVITEAVGKGPGLNPQVGSRPGALAPGEIYVLCTDGLTDLVSEREILTAVKDRDPQEACQRLVQLANARGGYDNITLQVVRQGLPPLPQRKTTVVEEEEGWRAWMKRSSLLLAVFALLALAIGITLGYIFYPPPSKKKLLPPPPIQQKYSPRNGFPQNFSEPETGREEDTKNSEPQTPGSSPGASEEEEDKK